MHFLFQKHKSLKKNPKSTSKIQSKEKQVNLLVKIWVESKFQVAQGLVDRTY